VHKLGTIGETTAAWSPDGSHLAFSGGAGHIRVYDRATGTTARLTPRLAGGDRVRLAGVAWSPDGQELLSKARTADRGEALVSLPIDGTSTEVRTPWTWALDWIDLTDMDWSSR
jgi:Tol biopolymer transport system component